jgi:hypothetical protein
LLLYFSSKHHVVIYNWAGVYDYFVCNRVVESFGINPESSFWFIDREGAEVSSVIFLSPVESPSDTQRLLNKNISVVGAVEIIGDVDFLP